MAQNSARTRSLRLVHPQQPFPDFPADISKPITIDLGSKGDTDVTGGVSKRELPDGGVEIDFNPQTSAPDLQGGFYENLALKIDEGELARIANELIELIAQDDESRKEWLQTRARGIKLLGLVLEEPKGEILATGTLEGMSTVRHPLLLDSILRFQANARGELLPASGPVKVRNDTPTPPSMPQPPGGGAAPPGMPPGLPPGMIPTMGMYPPGMNPAMAGMMPQMPTQQAMPHRQHGGFVPGGGGGPSGGGPSLPPAPQPTPFVPNAMMGGLGGMGGMLPGTPPPGAPPPAMGQPGGPIMFPGGFSQTSEDLATALEADMNHYLTAVAREYYPDTDRMLFWIGGGGQGIKKVYNCPLKQRPVSESVDVEDFIVSNAMTNLEGCGRVTHRIKMRPSTLKRLQIIGKYRDVPLNQTYTVPQNAVDQAKNAISGVKPPTTTKPEETDQEIYESYCELDIAGFEHKNKGKLTGLRVPYIVTIHKESRQILEIRRNWKEKDKLCMPKEYFVDFPFVRALGFYAIGLFHIVGNASMTLTAAWREMLDAGMFANFPGFLFNKAAGRQLSNQLRVPPGAGIGLEVGTGRIQDMVMPVPYKDPSAAFQQFIQHVEEVGMRVAGSAEVQIGEGNQEVPVGTTMAIIEQATKMLDAVHKRLHAAQAKEFQLLKERFREDPEAFWRHNKKPTIQWRKDQFLAALENNDLIPVADPNNPTTLHRIMKATAVKQLAMMSPQNYNMMEVDKRVMRIAQIDPEGLFNTAPTPPPPDPRVIALQQKAQAQQQTNQIQAAEVQIKAHTAAQDAQMQQAELASRERIEGMKLQQEDARIRRESIIHAHDMALDHIDRTRQMHADHVDSQMDLARNVAETRQDLLASRMRTRQEMQHDQAQHQMAMRNQAQEQAQTMAHQREQHASKLDQQRQLNDAKVEAAKAMAKAKPKPSKSNA